MLTALGSKEAEMRIIGCDLHASQQTIAMLDRETGEITDVALKPQSPHLTATLPVDALTDYASALQVFEKLRELAHETRASRK